MTKPYEGAISDYFATQAPRHISDLVNAETQIIDPTYPYPQRLKKRAYEEEMEALQIELVKAQSWIKQSKSRVVVLFEGRDAAGKGGTIKRLCQNLSPRVANVVALSKPSDREANSWYFQRYITHLPPSGEMTIFDRSWYNRAVVEPVFGFCTPRQKEQFFRQLPSFETMIQEDGIHLVKIWLSVSRAEQLKRFLAREADPLKQWKLSKIDVKGLSKWEAYSDAITQMFHHSHSVQSPWHVILSDDKRRARLNAIKTILSHINYADRDEILVHSIDKNICGGPDLLT